MEELQENKRIPRSVFISYAHEDEPLRWKLETHLSLLRRQGLIADWHDRQILAGAEWGKEIDKYLETASIILLLISPDGQTLVCYKTVWNLHRGELLRTLPTGFYKAGVPISPDGQMLATCDEPNNTIQLWNLHNGALLRTLPTGHRYWINCIAFSPGGHILATGGADDMIQVWNLHSGALLCTLRGHPGHMRSLAFSPDGHILASSDYDGTIKIWGKE